MSEAGLSLSGDANRLARTHTQTIKCVIVVAGLTASSSKGSQTGGRSEGRPSACSGYNEDHGASLEKNARRQASLLKAG